MTEGTNDEVFRYSKRGPIVGSLELKIGLTNRGQWLAECPCGWRTQGSPSDVVLALRLRDEFRQHLLVAHSPDEYPGGY